MNSNTKHVAVIGNGQMFLAHYGPAIGLDPRVDVVALVDASEANLARARLSQPRFIADPPQPFTSHEALIDAVNRGDVPQLDAVFVLTHADVRERIIVDLIEGFHRPPKKLMTEKPFVLTVASAQRLKQVAERAGVEIFVNHQYAVYTRGFVQLFRAEIWDQFSRGSVKWTRLHEQRRGAYAGESRGGLPWDLIPHVVMPWLDAANWPTVVAATPVRMPQGERLLHVESRMTLDTGIEVGVDVSDVLATHNPGTNLNWRHGGDWSLYMPLPTTEVDTSDLQPYLSTQQYGLPINSRIPVTVPTTATMTAANVRGFIDVLCGERAAQATGLTTAEQALAVTQAVQLVVLAHEHQAPVTLADLES